MAEPKTETSEKKPYTLNEFQKVAARIYADGDYHHLADDPRYETFESHAAFVSHLDEACGDVLFKFIMIELGEDVEDMDEAYRRMSSVHAEFEQILNEFAKIQHGPKPGA